MEFLKNGIIHIAMPSIVNARCLYKLKIQFEDYLKTQTSENKLSFFIFDLS